MKAGKWKDRFHEILTEINTRIKNGKPMYGTSRLRSENIKNKKSKLDLDCYGCNRPYMPTVNDFMNSKSNCQCWSNRRPWSERFDEILLEINNRIDENGKPMYGTSKLKSEDIVNAHSILYLDCYGCNKPYNPILYVFMSGKNCKCWTNNISWFERFNEILIEINNRLDENGKAMYGTSRLKSENITNKKSKLDLDCYGCNQPYTPTVENFMSGSNCKCWSNKIQWTNRYNEILIEINNRTDENGKPMYGTSKLKSEDIVNGHSILYLDCCRCNQVYTSTVNDFMNSKSNCRCWSDLILWKDRTNEILEEINRRVDKNGNQKYGISRLRIETIINSHSRLDLDCYGCDQPYTPIINNFMHSKADCSCWTTNGYSKIAIEWLNYVAQRDNINIQHAENGNEYQILGTSYKADGYCQSTNTIYEFYGDYWHGNPIIYDPNSYNTHSKKTMRQLYQETLDREKVIRDKGYNLVTIWGNEWKNFQKMKKINPDVILLPYIRT